MRRLLVASTTAAAVLAFGGVAWTADWGPFADSERHVTGLAELDADERAMVQSIDDGTHTDDPVGAAQFVDDNLPFLLSADVAASVDDEALANLFGTAFQHEAAMPGLLAHVVDAVADESEIYDDGLPPTLAVVTADNMAWFQERIVAPFHYEADEMPNDVRNGYLAVHDFEREVAGHPDSASTLSQAVYDHGLAEVVAAPDVGEARNELLRDLGRLQAVFLMAQRNAERGAALEADDEGALDSAEDADAERRQEALADRATWLAIDLYESDPTIRAAAEGEPFVGPTGQIKTDLTPAEDDALREWATSLRGAEGQQGPTFADNAQIAAGSSSVSSPRNGVFIEDRY